MPIRPIIIIIIIIIIIVKEAYRILLWARPGATSKFAHKLSV